MNKVVSKLLVVITQKEILNCYLHKSFGVSGKVGLPKYYQKTNKLYLTQVDKSNG